MIFYQQPEYTLKTILVGDSKVGKTSFLNLLNNKPFNKTTTTIGVDFASLYFNINNTYVKLNVWDTAGQERFVNIVRSYFHSICSIILLFDVSKPETLVNLEKWMEIIEYENTCFHKHSILLIGNKNDLTNNIDELQLNNFINKYNVIYREISCRNSSTLEETITLFISTILKTLNVNDCNGIISQDSFSSSFSLKYDDDDNDNDNKYDDADEKKANISKCCTIS